jgi:hypothetical protein
MKTPKKTIPEFVQRAESMLPMFKTSSNRPQPTAAPPGKYVGRPVDAGAYFLFRTTTDMRL